MSSLRSKILTTALAGVCVWLILLVVGAQIKYIDNRQQLNTIDDRVIGAQKENDRLSRELELMRQPDWLALLARARLNYKRPDENVVFVYKQDNSSTIGQPSSDKGLQPSNWQKWMSWIMGK